jgi:GNAT superfamily N-acetyltransferase
MSDIRLARTDAQLEACFEVMAELRPRIPRDDFLPQVRRQMESDRYQLAFLEHNRAIEAVAGFRIGECLAWGRYMYVYDLVTKAEKRSKGFGSELLDWLVALARNERCNEFHLDSGVQRFDAHRFYFRKRMTISSYHFSLKLP